jgi:hypothetical protein
MASYTFQIHRRLGRARKAYLNPYSAYLKVSAGE